MTDKYNRAIQRLAEYGEAVARLAKVSADRDERITEAHREGVSKAEIARITGLSWATVDRVMRAAHDEAVREEFENSEDWHGIGGDDEDEDGTDDEGSEEAGQ